MLSIGVLNSKGGVGKSLLSTVLAVRASRDFPRVAIVDLDPQLGAGHWFEKRGGREGDNPTVFTGEDRATDAIDALGQTGWDIAFFDGAPGSLELTEAAIDAVDFVVIPMRASDGDTTSTEFVVSACLEIGTPYLIVVNEAMPGGKKASGKPTPDRRAYGVWQGLRDIGQPVADTIVHRRNGYADAADAGKAIFDLKKEQVAKGEIDALYGEVLALAASTKKGQVHE